MVARWPRTSRLAAPVGVSRRSYPNPGGVRALPPLGKMEEAGAIRRSPQLGAGGDFISGLLEAVRTRSHCLQRARFPALAQGRAVCSFA